MHPLISTGLGLLLVTSLSGCLKEEVAERPAPAPLTQEAIGYYCNMTVQNHQGPKGQIMLKGQSKPVWFSSVRDTIAFTRLPEEPKNISAIYVTDMSDDISWEAPGNENWIEASSAYFVSGSSKSGGMGAPEQVPFSTKEAALKFAQHYGGQVVTYSDIPDSAILGPVEISNAHENTGHDTHEVMGPHRQPETKHIDDDHHQKTDHDR